MILLGKNAHMTKIQGPPVPADPAKGIVGSAGAVKWQGDVDCYIDEDLVDVVRGNSRVTVSQTNVDVPSNLPVWPSPEDYITVVRTGVLQSIGGAENPKTEVLRVRFIDGGFMMLGKVRFKTVRD